MTGGASGAVRGVVGGAEVAGGAVVVVVGDAVVVVLDDVVGVVVVVLDVLDVVDVVVGVTGLLKFAICPVYVVSGSGPPVKANVSPAMRIPTQAVA